MYWHGPEVSELAEPLESELPEDPVLGTRDEEVDEDEDGDWSPAAGVAPLELEPPQPARSAMRRPALIDEMVRSFMAEPLSLEWMSPWRRVSVGIP